MPSVLGFDPRSFDRRRFAAADLAYIRWFRDQRPMPLALGGTRSFLALGGRLRAIRLGLAFSGQRCHA
jgi:hypothetical protein